MHDYAVHELTATAAEACAPAWPDASANLRHYLENTGTPQGVDVDGMLHDIPSLHDGSQADAEVMAGKAVEDAQASGATGPVTYPFNTPWTPEGPDDSENWFYATGNYQYATDGTVTVYPPTDDNSEWTYTYDYRLSRPHGRPLQLGREQVHQYPGHEHHGRGAPGAAPCRHRPGVRPDWRVLGQERSWE